jgi:hypothetical protein
MNDENERSVASAGSVTAGIRKCIAAYEQIPWGWDGDCGANDIISRIAEECDKIDAARPAPTLTDAEREAIETAMNAYGSDNANPECAAIEATLWGLLERTK